MKNTSSIKQIKQVKLNFKILHISAKLVVKEWHCPTKNSPVERDIPTDSHFEDQGQEITFSGARAKLQNNFKNQQSSLNASIFLANI